MLKNLPANAGDWVSTPWVGKIPWRRKWQHVPGFLPGTSHGQKSLADYNTVHGVAMCWMQLRTYEKHEKMSVIVSILAAVTKYHRQQKLINSRNIFLTVLEAEV